MPREVSRDGIGTVERMLFLKRLPALASLPASDLGLIAESARERHFPRGSVLLHEGQAIGSLFCVIDGRVHVTRRGHPLGHAVSGAAVGGYAMFARDPEGLGAVAEADTLALELDSETVFELLEEHFSILRHLLRDVSLQLIGFQRRAAPGSLPAVPQALPAPPASRELDLVERIFFLRQAAPFRRSSINALAELSRGLTQVRLPPGRELWATGDTSGWVLLVVSGELECRVPEHDAPFVAGPGFPLGAVESVASAPRWYGARTRTTVIGLQGQVEGLIDVFEDNVEMAIDYLAVASAWLLEALEGLGQKESNLPEPAPLF